MGSAMLMGERVQRRESCDARRSEVGAYLYKTVMCEKSSVCVLGERNVAPCRAERSEDREQSEWSGHSGADRTDQTRKRRAP